MVWTLVVFVFGSTMVPTNMLFDSLEACLAAEEQMRSAYAEAYDDWVRNNPSEAKDDEKRQGMLQRMGGATTGTCVPTARG